MTQVGDITANHLPNDSISSLSLNGTPELYPTLLLAGSWDGTVS